MGRREFPYSLGRTPFFYDSRPSHCPFTFPLLVCATHHYLLLTRGP